MNKNKIFNVAAMLLLCTPLLSACDTFDKLFAKDLHITNEAEFNEIFNEYKDIYLENDITINALQGKYSHGFNLGFTDKTFDGQGHTITIKGTDGEGLAPLDCNSFFTDISNSTVRDLNVVYDFAYTQGGSTDVGGFIRKAKNCVIDHVTVKFNKTVTLDGTLAFDNATWGTTTGTTFAGLVANAYDTEISHCKVIGDLNFKTWTAGGLVGHLYDGSTLHHSSFEGGMTVNGYPRRERVDGEHETKPTSYIGTLVGKIHDGGHLYACESHLDKVDIETQSKMSFVGLAAGINLGKLNDVRIVAKKDLHKNFDVQAYYPFEGVTHAGVATGYSKGKDSVKRVLFDYINDPEFNKLQIGRMNGSVGRSDVNDSTSQIYHIGERQTEKFTLPAPDKNRFVGEGIEKMSFQFKEISNMIDNAGRLNLQFSYSKSTDQLFIVGAYINRADDEHIVLENFYEKDAVDGESPSISNISWINVEHRTVLVNIKIEKMYPDKTFNDGFNIKFELENTLFFKDPVSKNVEDYDEFEFEFANGEENYWTKHYSQLVIDI